MKKIDFIIIIIALVLAGLIYGGIKYNNYLVAQNSKEIYAEIQVNGEIYKKINLTEGANDTVSLETEDGKNIIVVEGFNVYMQEADCPDQVCVEGGAITKIGESIICLPHKVVVEIKGTGTSEVDAVVN
ncbi:NusG domain II-containing protein [Clostridium grantii]|uniref:Uncharacterized protein n=1 Tax=Clostridium grantii DSM 8605 TaxID=1121316 RepID=A0A1M5W561_9CLOT|nr:NusG domain II-containing protein [Clostridium grantii]SHH82581.1 hypothetical protein SAMN02745207_02673 [Clostridium grantii DSM 8605]